MRRRKTSEDLETSTTEWMATYGDMVTLLLTFFILLFSFSEIDAQKFKAIIQSFNGSPGVLKSGMSISDSKYVELQYNTLNTANDNSKVDEFIGLSQILQKYLIKENIQDNVFVEIEEKGLILRFQDNILFASGKAYIKDDSKNILLFLSNILKEKEFEKYGIRVEGHTDSDPILHSKKYPTNWELSIARASNVTRFLIEQTGLTPSRIYAAGFSEYKPIESNSTEEGKERNRRVDIVVLRNE